MRPFIIIPLWVIILWLFATDLLKLIGMKSEKFFNNEWRFALLGTLLFLAAITLTLYQKAQKKIPSFILFISIILFFASLVGHMKFTHYYQWLQKLPELETISTKKTIQADRVVITGKNFGSPDKKGTVSVEDLEFLIVSWNDNEVVIEQPVPNRYFVGDMVLTNYDGNKLIIEDFFIKDPSEVWQ